MTLPRLALAIFRDVTLGTSQEQPPRGVKRVDPVCRVTTQLQHSFLKSCTRRLRCRVEGCTSKVRLLAFSTTPPVAKIFWLSVLCCKKGLGVAVSVLLASRCRCLSRSLRMCSREPADVHQSASFNHRAPQLFSSGVESNIPNRSPKIQHLFDQLNVRYVV